MPLAPPVLLAVPFAVFLPPSAFRPPPSFRLPSPFGRGAGGEGLSSLRRPPFLGMGLMSTSLQRISVSIAMRGGRRFGVMPCGIRTSVAGAAPVACSPVVGASNIFSTLP